MKKFIALLLVAIMAITAVIPAMAAGNTDETAPDAPVFVGAQTRDSETENSSDVRFIATVSSEKGTYVGYEIVANYYEVGEATPTKTETYTLDETKSETVYTSVLEKGKTEATTADALTPGATGIFVVTLIGVPNGQSVDFTITAYVKYNGEDIPSTTKFQRYENGEIMVANTVYSQDFSTNYLTKLQEAGITPVLNGKPYISVNGGKLNLTDLIWGNCFLSAADYGDVAAAVGNNSAYMVQMDLSFDHLEVFSLAFNGECVVPEDSESPYKDFMANSAFVQIRAATTNNGTISPAPLNIAEGMELYARTRFLDATSSNMPSGNIDVNNNDVKAFTVPQGKTTADFKLTVVFNKLTNGTRLDLFIDSTHIASYESENEYWLEENKNPIVVWAEDSIMTMDNLRVVGVNTQVADGKTIPTDLDETNEYLQIFDDYECESPYRTFLYTQCKKTSWLTWTEGKLTTGWHNTTNHGATNPNPDYCATLIAPGKMNNAQTYYFETNFSSISCYGTELGIMIFNNTAVANRTDLNKNGCFIQLMTSGGKFTGKIHVTNYDADGNAVTYGDNNYRELVASNITSNVATARLGIMVDSTFASGTLVSVYVNGELAGSLFMEGNAYDTSSNTAIALWAENSAIAIDEITLKTYTAPIAA